LATAHFHSIFFAGKQYEPEPIFEKSSFSFLYKTAIKFLGVYSLAQPLLILAVVFNLLGLYTIIYFLMHLMVTAGILIFLLLKAKNN